jgi:hypothetical protein
MFPATSSTSLSGRCAATSCFEIVDMLIAEVAESSHVEPFLRVLQRLDFQSCSDIFFDLFSRADEASIDLLFEMVATLDPSAVQQHLSALLPHMAKNTITRLDLIRHCLTDELRTLDGWSAAGKSMKEQTAAVQGSFVDRVWHLPSLGPVVHSILLSEGRFHSPNSR